MALMEGWRTNSNTTLVKVKLWIFLINHFEKHYSNTTLVKVKLDQLLTWVWAVAIQIQHLLKLNTETINEILAPVEFKYNTC